MSNISEINRLVALGLTYITAMAVAEGKLDEAFEVDRAEERRVLHSWCRGKKNIPTALTAAWDLRPENFYLAFDGASPDDHTSDDFVVIYADIVDVDDRLTYNSSRDKDPWHPRYKKKSCGIAYRWLHGRCVTPPILSEFQSQVHIEGGRHRFHLAKHYGETRMPFLVRRAELKTMITLIPSAEETTRLNP